MSWPSACRAGRPSPRYRLPGCGEPVPPGARRSAFPWCTARSDVACGRRQPHRRLPELHELGPSPQHSRRVAGRGEQVRDEEGLVGAEMRRLLVQREVAVLEVLEPGPHLAPPFGVHGIYAAGDGYQVWSLGIGVAVQAPGPDVLARWGPGAVFQLADLGEVPAGEPCQ